MFVLYSFVIVHLFNWDEEISLRERKVVPSFLSILNFPLDGVSRVET